MLSTSSCQCLSASSESTAARIARAAEFRRRRAGVRADAPRSREAGGGAADAFLGTQGDQWDTQWDMFMALVGAVAALALDDRLGGAELVDAPLDDLDRLLDRLADALGDRRLRDGELDHPVPGAAVAPVIAEELGLKLDNLLQAQPSDLSLLFGGFHKGT